jgi:hypothetical protein
MSEDLVPINKATDQQLFAALKEAVIKPLEEEFDRAVAATDALLAKGMDAETTKAQIPPVWKEVWHKLESADYVLGHIKTRITRARMLGIMAGDPREDGIFKVTSP